MFSLRRIRTKPGFSSDAAQASYVLRLQFFTVSLKFKLAVSVSFSGFFS